MPDYKTFREAVDKLLDGYDGTFFWFLERNDGHGNDCAVVLGWCRDDNGHNHFHRDGYTLAVKLACQPAHAMMQCDYDVDWLMPFREDGGVWDTEMPMLSDNDVADAWRQMTALSEKLDEIKGWMYE